MTSANVTNGDEPDDNIPPQFQKDQNFLRISQAMGQSPEGDHLSNDKGEYSFMFWGDSMHPAYQTGQLMLSRHFPDWRKCLPFGEAFLIITKEFKLVRYVKQGKTDDTLLLCSPNPHFDDFEMKKDEIQDMFIITGSVRRNCI